MSSKTVGIVSLILGVIGIIISVTSTECRIFLGLEERDNVEIPIDTSHTEPVDSNSHDGDTVDSDSQYNNRGNARIENTCLRNIFSEIDKKIFVTVTLDGKYSGIFTTALIQNLNNAGIEFALQEGNKKHNRDNNKTSDETILDVDIRSIFNSTDEIISNSSIKEAGLITGTIEGSYIFNFDDNKLECPIYGVLAGKSKNQIINQLIQEEFKFQ